MGNCLSSTTAPAAEEDNTMQYLNSSSTEDWGNLDALPLSLIFNKLLERLDHIYFSTVCKNWYSIAKFNYQNRQVKNNVLPMLMIPKKRCRTKRCLYGISTNTTYPFQLPVDHNKRLCGSSYGWVAKMDDTPEGTIITLLNPFKSLVSITLPPLYIRDRYKRHRYPECDIHKVILSCNPTTRPHDYIVVVSYSLVHNLAFKKAGQQFWTFVNAEYYGFTDILFYKGLVYAVGESKNINIVSFDICNSNDSFDHEIIPNVVSSSEHHTRYCISDRAYLVESLEGDLFLVNKIMCLPPDGYVTGTCIGAGALEVYKLELDLQSGKLTQMIKLDSLGDNVLFVGDSHSVSMSASYFANYLQKDSIYYTDDFYDQEPHPYPKGPFDMKIHNIKDECKCEHRPFQPWFRVFRRMPPSLWVIPPFQWD